MTASALLTPAYVALGSNLDRPREQVEQAIRRLAGIPDTLLVCHSRLYRSAPLGPQDQPDFVNAAAGLLTRLDALTLVRALHDIERAMGKRPPEQRWGPRRIDLDLLLHGQSRSETAELTLPHPGLLTRNFVIQPLNDIAPDLQLPQGMTVAALARRLGAAGLSECTA